MGPLQAKPGSPTCVIQGTITSQGARLPGVALTLTDPGDRVVAAGSTDVGGAYVLAVPGPGSYRLTADMAFFDTISRDVTVDATCKAVVDLELILRSRVPKPAAGMTALRIVWVMKPRLCPARPAPQACHYRAAARVLAAIASASMKTSIC